MNVKKFTIAMLSIFVACSLCAQQGRMIRIVDLNADCVDDTLVGGVGESSGVMTSIHWGDRRVFKHCDTGYYRSQSYVQWRRRTEVRYDGYVPSRTDVRRVLLNNDRVKDMLLVIRGVSHTIGQDSTIATAPVSMLIALFSQRGLDSLHSITLGRDTGLVRHPFPHVYLLDGMHYTTVQRADRSGMTYQTMPRMQIPVNVEREDQLKEVVEAGQGPEPVEFSISAVPNPSESEFVTIISSVPIGAGSIEVYTMQGLLVSRKELEHDTMREVRIQMGAHDFGSGMYLLRAARADGVSASTYLVLRR
jgi:hypothetical protein